MMVFKINEEGYFVEDITLKEGESMPANCIATRPPEPCYKPRWNGEKWIDEGEPPIPQPQEPTAEERLEALEQAMLEIVLGGIE